MIYFYCLPLEYKNLFLQTFLPLCAHEILEIDNSDEFSHEPNASFNENLESFNQDFVADRIHQTANGFSALSGSLKLLRSKFL